MPSTHAERVGRVLDLMGRHERTGWIADRVALAVACLSDWFFIDEATKLKSYIDGIDLSKPVERMDLIPPLDLVGYRHSPEVQFHQGAAFGMFGMYFTNPGTSKHDVGIKTDDRRFLRYTLQQRTVSLRSTAASGFISGFGPVHGGAVQYIIPRADRVLRVTHIQHSVR